MSRVSFCRSSFLLESVNLDRMSISTFYDSKDIVLGNSDSDNSSEETIDMSEIENSDQTDAEYDEDEDCNKMSYRRNMLAFFLFGLCHKMTYNMTLAASRDILYYYVWLTDFVVLYSYF